MAITDKKTGPWGLDQVYNKINQGSIWDYSGVLELFSWGNGTTGRNGQNNTTTYSSPIQIPGTTWANGEYKYGIGGNNVSVAIRTDGTLWAWGNNQVGQLGVNNITQYSSPKQVGSGTDWRSLGCWDNNNSATKTDGTLWSWGQNSRGAAGQNSTANPHISSPVQVGSDSDWGIPIGCAGESSGCIKTDGTLWMWGRNGGDHGDGVLGQNNTTQYSSPVQIPGTTWRSINGGRYHYLATKTDGTLWARGENLYGNLGSNDEVKYSSPVQIPGTTWNYAKAGSRRSLATKTDGTLWAWGQNSQGGLGQNNRTDYSSPVQIPGTTWDKPASGGNFMATKTDGTLWACGYNVHGDLGNNEAIARSSPVQIAGTGWGWIHTGYDGGCGASYIK